ncbi:MAG TPA: ABC transporter permease [Clostridiaceae bacterium]|nr:ABC transporter permease [Clostridiaceae bacterium]
MLFKLSIKNMKKSFKDYAIYFITLVLGVAVFYMFNSIDSQEAMLQVSSSTKQMIKLMINMLGMVSVFIAVILGLLIVYANNFLINRRKKEFGIYMTLGMGKRQISKILLIETVFVGIISLAIGLILGIFASQFMSILVAKLFQADMSKFEFVFSQNACIKTCIYFAVMYLAVLLFNALTISRYKLINLLTAIKKNEQIKMKNPIVCIIVFIIAAVGLGYAYWEVTKEIFNMTNVNDTTRAIGISVLLGVVGTILIFWSFSGLILRLVQAKKSTYLKGTNMFVLRQLHNKINTTVISMSVICLMLFMTITALSSSIALKNSMQADLEKMTPVDLNLYKTANLPEKTVNSNGKEITYTQELQEDSKQTISYTLTQNGFDMNNLKDVIETPIYVLDGLTWETTLGNAFNQVKKQFPMMKLETPEQVMKISDYNKIAKLYGNEQYSLEDDEYIIICNYENIANIRNLGLKENTVINLKEKNYKPKYNECKDGFIQISTSHTNVGIILVPDSCNLGEKEQNLWFLAANYNAKTDDEKKKIEENFSREDSSLVQKLNNKNSTLDGESKISIVEASVGLSTIIVFIAIYLGIIFLIASCAILALKQLTESSDNRQRYIILRKIGCDEKMINQALFRQIGIFFGLPLVLAIIHSIFGIQFAMSIFETLASKEQLLPSIIVTAIVIGIIYGCYFLATYIGSKNIIKEEE